MTSFSPQWSSYPSLVQPELVRDVGMLARLQLPPTNNSSAQSSAIERFVDDVHTGVMVTPDTRNLAPPRSLMFESEIAYSNPGSKYQSSLPADTDSLSNNSYFPFQSPTDSSSGSPEEEGHRRQSPSPSPDYHDPEFGRPFGQSHNFMSRASDLDARVDPSLAPSGYVCPRSVHISNEDDYGQEDLVEDEEGNDYRCQPTMPTMFQPYYKTSYYDYDQHQPPPPVAYTQQRDHSVGHDHSCSSAQGSRQNSPTRVLKLKTNKSRRNKCPPGMMKPFAASPGEGEKPRKLRGEKTRGRGAGKKPKERKVCRDHPTKVFNHASDFKKHMNQQHHRPFLCVFYFAGCGQTFGSKNEWKRHVNSQHLQLSYWHCDDSMCADRKAIFNRKDLFGQHLKRMHSPPEGSDKPSMISYTERVIERCRVERRKPPQESRCGYCEHQFSGEQGWEQRMEHVGQHYEKNNHKHISRDRWVPDEGLIAWALRHGIIEHNGDGGYTIVSTGKDAIVKAGVEQKMLARAGYADDDDDDDYDAEGDDEFIHT